MALSTYHTKYQARSAADIEQRVQAKEHELEQILKQLRNFSPPTPTKVAVLGCADIRFIPAHKQIFEKLFKKAVEVTTFDITTEHLQGAERVVKHDCTLPLPDAPYDIIYSNVLLPFVETEKQWNILENSYRALAPGGLAIHLLDAEDYLTTASRLPNGNYSVPLERWKEKLEQSNIRFVEIPVKTGPQLSADGLAIVLRK